MPGGDRTGPSGEGPMTGRSAGYCAGASAPGSVSTARRGGFGGGGRHGRRHRFYATGQTRGADVAARQPASAPQAGIATAAETATTTDPGQGTGTVEDQVERLATVLEAMQKRIAELERRPHS